VDSENRYRFVNRAFAEILDYEPGEILGKYRPDFAAEGYKKRAEKQLDEILRHKKTIREEMEFVKKNGELIIVEHTLTPIVEEGKIKYIVGIARDITQRKRLEDELKESERKYRELFELMPDMVLILDLNGNILEVNSAAERMTGYSREELLKMNIRQIDIEEGDERVDERIKQLLERGFAEFEVKHRRKDGTVYDVDVHAKLIDYRGRKAIMAVDRDISERKKMVEELKKYERFYKNAQDMFFIIDKNGKFVDVNPKFAEMLGYDVNELIKHTSKKITYHEDLNRVKDFFARILNGESLRGEFRAVAKDGRILWFELVEWPVYDNGKVIEVEGIVRDITERKRLEEELKKSEEKYRLIVENSRDIIFAVNPNGIATYVSPSVERIMGYKSGELIGNSVFEYIHPEDLDSVKSEFFNVVSKKRQGKVVHRIKRQDGEWIFVESVGAPMFDEDGSFIGSVIVTRDVTERIELEQKLISSEAKHKETAELLQRIIDLAPIAITGWDKEYKINMWNKTAENMFGWKAEEVMGKDLFEIQVPEYEKENVRKAITEVMETGISNKNINEDITKDGKRLICEWYNMAVKDAEGNIIGGISLGIDLTERIKMEEELKRLNKLLVTINEISKLIVHEKDKEELLTKACMELAKLEDYYTVAICLVENDKIVPVAISRASLSLFLKILAECGLIRKASKRKLIFANSETACVKCRLKQKEFKQVLAIPMVVDGEVRGVIIIYLGVDKKLSKDEIELLQTLANDIAFGIKSIEVEEQRRKAFEQITKNIEQFAVLIDSIRNPLTVIVGLAEIKGDEISEISELIIQQVGRIEKIIKQLDEGWIESERVREFLKKSMK
jgi:PAS domain S-box-containing protein